jgi:gamma-glutamyltranspeptidase
MFPSIPVPARSFLARRTPSFTAALVAFRIWPLAESGQVDQLTSQPFATRSGVIGARGIVCTSHPLASPIGLEGLMAGEITDHLDACFSADGGALRGRDFEQHTSTGAEPISTDYRR